MVFSMFDHSHHSIHKCSALTVKHWEERKKKEEERQRRKANWRSEERKRKKRERKRSFFQIPVKYLAITKKINIPSESIFR